jgi:predicted nucleotidyltransferase
VRTESRKIKLFVNDLLVRANQVFSDRCIAVYVMGSLARGGFSELTSDIDIGILLTNELKADDVIRIESIRSETVQKYSSVKNSLSIFWGSIESINGLVNGGRYPPFDRLDLIDHGLLLEGVDCRHKLRRPNKQELEIASANFALDYLAISERLNEFCNCELISAKGVVYVTKTILFPARFIYLEKTGQIAGNDASYQYYIDSFNGKDADLVTQGYKWRHHSLPSDLDKVTNLLNDGLVALYCRFIDIYTRRMELYEQSEIRSQLLDWKANIS